MSRKKKAIIQSGIEAQDAYYQKKYADEEAERIRKSNEAVRPNLLKRFASILLDGLMIGAIIAGIYAIAYFGIYPQIGYQSSLTQARQVYADSHLYYVTEEGKFESLVNHYDEGKTPAENYDGVITTYYTVDPRAIENNCLTYYGNAKLASGLFEKNGDDIVELSTAVKETLKSFYEEQYNNALSFLDKDPQIIKAGNYTLMVNTLTMIIASLIATIPFYLIIPLCRKEGETLGQMVCKLVLVNEQDRGLPKKKQIVIRYLTVYFLIYLLPICLNILWTWAFGLPVFAVAGMIAFKKNNASFHDFLSKTVIINKSRTNAFETLKAIQGQNPQQ